MFENKKKATTSIINPKKRAKKEIKEKIKEIKIRGVDGNFIIRHLNSVFDFVGVFAQNKLHTLRYIKIPFVIIVNLDYNDEPGSHWLAIRVDRETIEVFDSLGFETKYFAHYPKLLINFLARFSFNKRVICSPVLQPPTSKLCGLYCIYYVLNRQTKTFVECLSLFSSNLLRNDLELIKFFK